MLAMQPRLLDLFCGAGGCAAGYARAGFHVVGVDNRPQPRYPFTFVHGEALDILTRFLVGGIGATAIDTEGRHWSIGDFAAIHASPPCQRYSRAAFTNDHRSKHQDLLPTTRMLLEDLAIPYVIENVDCAPMRPPAVMLCGLMFGLKVFRHRWFESSALLLSPSHPGHKGKKIGRDGMCCVVGHGGGVSRRMRESTKHGAGGQQNKAQWQAAMAIDWMSRNELAQAIPPAYAEFVGRQLIRVTR
jgi:DNA (cytosine-5)-methyltransferase 1